MIVTRVKNVPAKVWTRCLLRSLSVEHVPAYDGE
jgi:hypothetical protein